MPEKRFVRRRSNILDQAPLVSPQEQARLLNDPTVPIEHRSNAGENDNDHKTSGTTENGPIGLTRREFVANERAA